MCQLKNRLAAAGIIAVAAWPAFAAQVFYKTGTTQEICPLTGLADAADKDGKKFGVVGTDLGYSFVHKGQLYFLFGDTNGRQGTAVDDLVEIPPGTRSSIRTRLRRSTVLTRTDFAPILRLSWIRIGPTTPTCLRKWLCRLSMLIILVMARSGSPRPDSVGTIRYMCSFPSCQ